MVERRAASLPLILRVIGHAANAEGLALSMNQWHEIALAARQQRLRPLLHVRCQECGWNPPEELSAEWASAYHRAAVRVLRQKAELIRITRWFADADIGVHVLKGGAIVWRGWFDPRVRPMRDLDLLVSAGQAGAAQQLLLARGFSGSTPGARASSKHLPGVVAPKTRVVVEIHTRLIDAMTTEWTRRDQVLCELAMSRAVCVAVADGGFSVFADDDTLLHLIVHAVLDHQFNNGPLLLIDMHALVVCGQIDWPRFWATAQAIGALRAAQLALRLAEAVWPELSVCWHGNEPVDLDPSSVASAARLMLVAPGQQTELGFMGRLSRFRLGEQSVILLNSIRRKTNAPEPASQNGDSGRLATLSRRLANIASRAGRDHIRRSLQVAKWLRE